MKTRWINSDNSVVTLQKVLERLKDEPVIYIDINTILRNPKVLIDPKIKNQADPAQFILLHNDTLLDGYHRVARAVDIGMSHIPAKVLRGELFAPIAQ